MTATNNTTSNVAVGSVCSCHVARRKLYSWFFADAR
jgi:hypothetical protein